MRVNNIGFTYKLPREKSFCNSLVVERSGKSDFPVLSSKMPVLPESLAVSFGVRSKNKNSDFVFVEGMNENFGVKTLEKQTKDGVLLERKTFAPDGKSLWHLEKFRNGTLFDQKTFVDGQLIWHSEYIDGVLKTETKYSASEVVSGIKRTSEGFKPCKIKVDHNVELVKEYQNGKLKNEKFYHYDGKTLHLEYKYDDNQELVSINSFREDGSPYHSQWECDNGLCPKNICEDEMGIPFKDYEKVFGPKKDLPWAKK